MNSTEPRQYPTVDAACLQFKKFLQSLEPSAEVREHFRTVRIEVLKGLRQMIDNRIAELSRTAETGRKIDVE
ncbi:MAG TPA: hypothetical protein VFL57_20830 [Bryobacteraceae bacterium]|nr:hypothetical protein [Bryobacteraceae bacterium]